jgi:AcrR family transcriptional regulator
MEELTRREREKKIREEEILSAAEKIFYEKGFHDTSMDEIAKAAQFSKKALYLYFINKEDIYFTVVAREFKMVLVYFERGIKNGTTGLDKVRLLSEAYYDYYKDYPQSFRMMNYCQFIQSSRENISHYNEISEIRNKLFQNFANVIEEGKTDGSIRKDLNTKDTVMSLFMLITGFFSRFAELGKINIDLNNNDHERFISSTLDLIEQAITANK